MIHLALLVAAIIFLGWVGACIIGGVAGVFSIHKGLGCAAAVVAAAVVVIVAALAL